MIDAEEISARLRQRQLEERRELAEILGIQIPVLPPRNPGESDREYGVRLAWIAKSYCGPEPKPKTPPRRTAKPPPEAGKAGKADNSTYQPPSPEVSQNAQFVKPKELDGGDGERLANMMADPTTEDDP